MNLFKPKSKAIYCYSYPSCLEDRLGRVDKPAAKYGMHRYLDWSSVSSQVSNQSKRAMPENPVLIWAMAVEGINSDHPFHQELLHRGFERTVGGGTEWFIGCPQKARRSLEALALVEGWKCWELCKRTEPKSKAYEQTDPKTGIDLFLRWLYKNAGQTFSSKTGLIDSVLSDPDFYNGARKLGIGGEDGQTLRSAAICYRQQFLGGTLGKANTVSCKNLQVRERGQVHIVAVENGGLGEQIVTF